MRQDDLITPDEINRQYQEWVNQCSESPKPKFTVRTLLNGVLLIGATVTVHNRPGVIRAISQSPYPTEEEAGIVRVYVVYTDHPAAHEWREKPGAEWVLPWEVKEARS